MIQSFTVMSERVKELKRQKLAVAAAHDGDVLSAVTRAARLGLVDPILIGRRSRILELASTLNLDLAGTDILDMEDDGDICQRAVDLVRQGQAGAVMKGLVPTALILKAILNKESGIRDKTLLSHMGLFFPPQIGRPLIVTDAAMNIAPDLKTKKAILENAVEAARLLGLERPKLACLCALETVNPAMQATVDARALVEMNRSGEIQHCLVGGPLALDNALFPEAARIKKIEDPVAGRADILLMPNIEAGNVLYKALTLLCNAPGAGLVLGARAPVILSSRSDQQEAKLFSIILALYLAAMKEV